MNVEKLESTPPGNPFHHDAYHMGMYAGKNVAIMMKSHSNEECPYIIVVDMKTGERLKITF